MLWLGAVRYYLGQPHSSLTTEFCGHLAEMWDQLPEDAQVVLCIEVNKAIRQEERFDAARQGSAVDPAEPYSNPLGRNREAWLQAQKLWAP